ncbi:MAG: hypothetical protein IPJ04_01570 [Candidatus Eisenbacteria bacterium]|nr:hypothetical protein [Candidatus Eisenbacteria bacterium]
MAVVDDADAVDALHDRRFGVAGDPGEGERERGESEDTNGTTHAENLEV